MATGAVAPTPFVREQGPCPVCGGKLVLDGAQPLRLYLRCRGRFGLEQGCGYTDVRAH